MTDTNMQDLVTDIEKQLLDAIIANLDENKMNADDAQAMAKEFLSLLPMQDKRDLVDKLFKLSQDHVEAKGVYLKIAKPFEEEERLRKIHLMSEHIKNGQIEHAITVAKGGTPNG